MMTPVCIKLHNFKKFKIEHEGQLYELAATNSENLLSEFQKYKPEVRQLLVARPIDADDFETLAEGSVVFASTQSYITEAQMQGSGCEIRDDHDTPHEHAMREYKSPTTTHSTAIVSYSTSPTMVHTHCPERKLRTDLSMLENFCPPPSGFIEAPVVPGPVDTIEVARRVRDILDKHKISQTLFSKYVIRRSQGTTSDLLRTPKLWDRMSEEGRTPYRRMKAWLEGDLGYNIQMLVKLKQGHDVIPTSYFTPKGLRTKFTKDQRNALEDFFISNPRLTHDTLETFASDNNLTISAVRNWVNNRKQRLKRTSSSSFEENDAKFPKNEEKLSFDEDVVERRDDGQDASSKENSPSFTEPDSNGDLTSPTLVNGSSIRNEESVEETMKPRQGFSSASFSTPSKIPTMVGHLAMDCMRIPPTE